jgi:hypothetical protein
MCARLLFAALRILRLGNELIYRPSDPAMSSRRREWEGEAAGQQMDTMDKIAAVPAYIEY